MNRIFAVIVILSFSQVSLACQYSANANELEGAREDRGEMRNLVSELAEQADVIFIGSVKSKENNSFTFQDIVNLKGETKDGSKFTWEKPSEFIVGCGGVASFAQLHIPGEDFEQGSLVYVKDRKILRMNLVGSFADEPSGYEEIEWLSK